MSKQGILYVAMFMLTTVMSIVAFPIMYYAAVTYGPEEGYLFYLADGFLWTMFGCMFASGVLIFDMFLMHYILNKEE